MTVSAKILFIDFKQLNNKTVNSVLLTSAYRPNFVWSANNNPQSLSYNSLSYMLITNTTNSSVVDSFALYGQSANTNVIPKSGSLNMNYYKSPNGGIAFDNVYSDPPGQMFSTADIKLRQTYNFTTNLSILVFFVAKQSMEHDDYARIFLLYNDQKVAYSESSGTLGWSYDLLNLHLTNTSSTMQFNRIIITQLDTMFAAMQIPNITYYSEGMGAIDLMPNITSFVTNTTSIYLNDSISINVSGFDSESDDLYYGIDCNYPVGGNVNFNTNNMLYCLYNHSIGTFTSRIYLTDNVHLSNYSEYTEFTVTVNPNEQCNNYIDDDGDGFIDYPNDIGCTNIYDNNETNIIIPEVPIIPNQPGGGGSPTVEEPIYSCPGGSCTCNPDDIMGNCYYEEPPEEYIEPELPDKPIPSNLLNISFSFNKYDWLIIKPAGFSYLNDIQVKNSAPRMIRLSFKINKDKTTIGTENWVKFKFGDKYYSEIAAVNLPQSKLFTLYKYIPFEVAIPKEAEKTKHIIVYEVKDEYGFSKELKYVVNTGDETAWNKIWYFINSYLINFDIKYCSDITKTWNEGCSIKDLQIIRIRLTYIQLIIGMIIIFIIIKWLKRKK
jgi:hypothetical protein